MTEVASAPTIEYRTLDAIQEEMVAAVNAKDTKRLRELSAEMVAADKHWQAEENRALQAQKEARMLPLRDGFVRLVERTEGMTDFIRQLGGVLSFSLTLKDGEEAPVVAINIGSTPVAAARAPRAASTNGDGTPRAPGAKNRGFVVNGEVVALDAAFKAVASEEEQAELASRVDQAKDSSKNSVGWAYKTRVVNKGIEAGLIQQQE